MNATLGAAIHLGNDHDLNLRNVQNSSWITTGQFFGDTEKLISGQTETTGFRLIDSKDLKWISTSLLHSRAYQYANAKVYVFSDSVLCMGKWETIPVNLGRTRSQWYSENSFFSELNRIEGGPRKFEWKIFQDSRQRLSSMRFIK